MVSVSTSENLRQMLHLYVKLNCGIRSSHIHDPSAQGILPRRPLAVEPPGLEEGRYLRKQHGILNGWCLLVLKPNVYFCIDRRGPRGSSFSSRWLLLHVIARFDMSLVSLL